MMPLRFGNARQQQQTVRRIIRPQPACQLRRPVVIARRQRDINSSAARVLGRRIAGHQVVIDDPGLFIHFAALIETRHGEHQVGILRVALHRAHQLVIRRRVVALLAQVVRFVNHIAVADTGQLRRRTARLQLRVGEQPLRFVSQACLVKHRHLVCVIPGIARDTAVNTVAHQRYRGGHIAALGQQARQFTHIRRGFWRRRGHRP